MIDNNSCIIIKQQVKPQRTSSLRESRSQAQESRNPWSILIPCSYWLYSKYSWAFNYKKHYCLYIYKPPIITYISLHLTVNIYVLNRKKFFHRFLEVFVAIHVCEGIIV